MRITHRRRTHSQRPAGGALLAMLLLAGATFSPAASAQTTDPLGDLEVHGFVSQGYIKSTKNKFLAESEGGGSFEFSEAGINFTKPVLEDLRVGMQLFARDLGPIGNYTAKFDWFYLDYRLRDWLGLRFGRTKLPFGLYNESSDVDAARVPILLPQSIYPAQNRDVLLAQTGAEAYGYVSLSEVGALEYRLYGGTVYLDPGETQGLDGFTVPYIVGGRLMWLTPLDGLQLGGSLQALKMRADITPPPETLALLQAQGGMVPADFDGNFVLEIPAVLWVASVEYTAQNLILSAEYSRWRVGVETDVPELVRDERALSDRSYVMASYQVAPWFTPGLYYAATFPRVEDRRGRDAYQHDFAVSFRYDLNPFWILKLEGHYMRGTAGLDAALNGTPLSRLAPQWGLFLAKTTAYF